MELVISDIIFLFKKKLKCWLNRADTAPVTICRDTCVRSKALHAFLLLFVFLSSSFIFRYCTFYIFFHSSIILLVITILNIILVYFRLISVEDTVSYTNYANDLGCHYYPHQIKIFILKLVFFCVSEIRNCIYTKINNYYSDLGLMLSRDLNDVFLNYYISL